MSDKPTPEYETVSSAAARLGMHPDTLRARIDDGDLTLYDVGTSGRVRVRVADVDALMRPRAVSSNA